MKQDMTLADIAWLSGLLEGEGCFTKSGARGHYGTPRVILRMTDEDVVRKAAFLMATANVNPLQPKKGKMIWSVEICSQLAIDVMKIVLPYMGSRRSARIKELIEFWDARPGASGAMSERMKKFWANKTPEERREIGKKLRAGESWGAGGHW